MVSLHCLLARSGSHGESADCCMAWHGMAWRRWNFLVMELETSLFLGRWSLGWNLLETIEKLKCKM